MDKVRVQWQCSCRSRAALESCDSKVAGLRIDERRVVSIAVTVDAMAQHAIAQIQAVSALFGTTEAVFGCGIAGTNARILGERTARGRGNEQNREANHSVFHHALSLEREVESGEETVAALVGAAVGRLRRLERREL